MDVNIIKAEEKKSLFHNLLSKDNYFTSIKEATDEIISILYNFCGPYANNAILKTIIRDNATLMDSKADLIDRFTKDGISIFSKLQSRDPVVQMLCRVTRHVGRLVEQACQDGTTTAMMTFAGIINRLMEKMYGYEMGTENADSHRLLLIKNLKEILGELDQVIKTRSYTVKELEELLPDVPIEDIKYSLVYHAVLLSSKGDKELAHKLALHLSTFPVELNGMMPTPISPLETKEKYILQSRDYEFSFRCAQLAPQYLNHPLEGKLDYKNADVFIGAGDITADNHWINCVVASMLADISVRQKFLDTNTHPQFQKSVVSGEFELSNFQLHRSLIGDRPFIFILPSPTGGGHLMFDCVKEVWNQVHRSTPVVSITLLSSYISQILVPEVLMTCGDKYIAERVYAGEAVTAERPYNHFDYWDAAILHNVHVVCYHNNLFLDNIFPKGGKDLQHPSYTDPTRNAHYTYLLELIRKKIDDVQKGHVGNVDEKAAIDEFVSLYRQMTHRRISDLHIGGMTYDTVSNVDVVTDSLGAAMSVLDKGFVLTGYCKLAHHCMLHAQLEQDPHREAIYTVFAEAFLDTLCAIYRQDPKELTLRLEPSAYKQCYLKADLEKGLKSQSELTLQELARQDLETCNSEEDVLKSLARIRENCLQHEGAVIQFDPRDLIKVAEIKNQEGDVLKNLEQVEIIPLQPIVGYEETFKRYSSLLPNFINSVALIVTED